MGGSPKDNPQQAKAFHCGVQHIHKLQIELQSLGLGLRDTNGQTQCQALLLILQYLGVRGINTLEGVGLGFYRIATRIQDLEDAGWEIASMRENLIGSDGLFHKGIARYVFLGKRKDILPAQLDLDLEA